MNTLSETLDYYCLVFLWYFARILIYFIMPVGISYFIYRFITDSPKRQLEKIIMKEE